MAKRFTDDEERVLNEWARTQPSLRKHFPYTAASDDGRGLGTLLNDQLYVSGGGTSGISTVSQTNGAVSFSGVTEMVFNSDDFYVTQNTDTSKAIVNFRGSTSGGGSSSTGTVTQSFSGVEWEFTHNLNKVPVLWNIFDNGYEAFIPDKADVSNPNIAFFYFNESVSGHAIVSSGVTSTAKQTFTSSVEWIFDHYAGSRPLLWNVFDNGYEAFIPDKVDMSDINIAYFYMNVATAGTAIVSTG